jgi:glycosyltransferase involved in cell wall biosynthesis
MAQRPILLLLIPHLGGGGAERVVALLANGLSPAKYDLHLGLITQASAGSECLPACVHVHGLGAPRVRAAAFQLLRLVRDLKPDVILSGMAHLNFLVLLLRPFFPRKTRVLVRQNGISKLGPQPAVYTRLLYRLLYPRADRILCQTPAMAAELADLWASPKKLHILPNPVDVDAIRALARGSSTRFAGPGPHLLAVGRLAHEKGLDLLLESFVSVRAGFPSADLTIIGVGPRQTALKTLCRTLGLEAAVHFAGNVPHPAAWFPGATLFVLSSRHEGLPNALLEAAAGGLPIVALPARGGLAELLNDRPGIWVAPQISADALSTTLRTALGAIQPGQRFAHDWIHQFRMDRVIQLYEKVIDTLLIRRPGMNHIALMVPTIDRLGGAERQVLLVAKGLLKRGRRVTVIALSGNGGEAAGELLNAGAGFMTLAMRKGLADPRGWIRLHRWLRRQAPDVVHAHLPHAVWMARWSRLFAPVRVLVDTVHTSATGAVGRRLGYRWSNFLSDRVTAVSRGAADAYLSAGMISPSRLGILPNGIDVQRWMPDTAVRAEVRRNLAWSREFVWIAAGRLDAVKDYPTLLQALTRVPTPARLLIAGAGPLEGSLRQLSNQLGLEGRVHFLGFQQDVRPWLQAADGFVLSSLWEGLPMCLLEAAACALPAVATDVPGSREVLAEGQTGFLAKAGDALALAAAMTRLMQLPPHELQAMGHRARQLIIDRFNLESVLDRWESLYNELCETYPRPGRRSSLDERTDALKSSACDGAASASCAVGDATSHISRTSVR